VLLLLWEKLKFVPQCTFIDYLAARRVLMLNMETSTRSLRWRFNAVDQWLRWLCLVACSCRL